MFEYVIDILKGLPGHPKDKQKQVDDVIKILTEGKGFLTIKKPSRIIFYHKIPDVIDTCD